MKSLVCFCRTCVVPAGSTVWQSTKDSILVTVHEVDLLPDKMQDKAPSAFDVWLVEGNEWNSIHLNTHLLAPEQVREEFINLISRLKYDAIVSYLNVY